MQGKGGAARAAMTMLSAISSVSDSRDSASKENDRLTSLYALKCNGNRTVHDSFGSAGCRTGLVVVSLLAAWWFDRGSASPLPLFLRLRAGALCWCPMIGVAVSDGASLS